MFLAGMAGFGLSMVACRGRAWAAAPPVDATFLFSCDIHACLISTEGLAPNCEQEGKTDANLLRHVAALNAISEQHWPDTIDGKPSGLQSAGARIARPLGLVLGGDITDDGGGQVRQPREGRQLQQFQSRYEEGRGPHHIHLPVYVGLGNHDLDQDGPPPNVDWYRRELRDYVELTHRQSVFYKPPVPVTNYDPLSDNYSWDWGGLHLVQLQRFGGDENKGAINGLPWLRRDLASYAADGRPVALFQHYGWDPFSIEIWDSEAKTFDDQGQGQPHWWSSGERAGLLDVLKGYNIVGIFHGHEHDRVMAYRVGEFDVFKPRAAYLGGFAVVRVTDSFMDMVFAEARGENGASVFTQAFSKRFN
ncbi:metallophosphoesterase [Sinorhizobium numidicum]|uniref:Metallophosphoesterase n=1 Tax=Sinorhizobium numidicum TaxID=680248 RepID=A0ABY8D2E7_9HYPH|nr:metallophosphoesterase [Sinorhizobium numidicum]WEX79250.1 metallophosphoesterase [Sinorhizobium numidicum]WEX85068.1 metallophosphoesterase [Sinorhizobium numidicum]